MSLDIHRNNSCTVISSFCGQARLGMPRVMQNSESASSREWVEVWSCCFFFCMVLDIRCSHKFVQLFQVGLVKYTHSDSKQRVSYITKIAEVWSRFFACSLTYINASFWFSPFIHSYGYGQVHLVMLKVIPTVWISNMSRLNWAMMSIFCIWISRHS